MRSLSVKLILLFIGIALISVGVVAIWVHNSVHTEFSCYCQRIYQGQGPPDSTYPGPILGGQDSQGMLSYMGAAEQAFLDAFNNSLWLGAIAAVLIAVALGLLFSQFITGPLRQLALATRKIATGDFSPRVSKITDDEVGEVSVAFNAMAEQLDRKEKSRRQLLADIAHELRNPLSIIQGNMEAWIDGVIPPTPEQIASVYDETILLSRLITDLRELSLAEAGQLKLHQEATDLREFISAEIASIQNRCQEKQISIGTDLSPQLPSVFIDRDRIRQVLHNLIDNALRYTSAGGNIKIRASVAEPGRVTIAVSDSGSGIQPEDLPYIFDHFYKADRSRHRGYGGAGIGLSMVKQLVELHGGRAWVDSQPGIGSTFYFTLPVA